MSPWFAVMDTVLRRVDDVTTPRWAIPSRAVYGDLMRRVSVSTDNARWREVHVWSSVSPQPMSFQVGRGAAQGEMTTNNDPRLSARLVIVLGRGCRFLLAFTLLLIWRRASVGRVQGLSSMRRQGRECPRR